MVSHTKKVFYVILLIALAGFTTVFYRTCVPHTSRLDEVVFYEGPEFKLKIVRYYENLPLHYVGEVFRVMCQSANTRSRPGQKFQDAGWRTLTNGGAIGTKSAGDLIQTVKPRFKIIDDRILAYQSNIVLLVTFDACGRFSEWNPKLLPRGLIAPPPEGQRCIKLTDRSCQYDLFAGDRFPVFDEIVANKNGHISFLVKSKALLIKGSAYRVESADYGESWKYTPVI
jgi:hypothetical protein